MQKKKELCYDMDSSGSRYDKIPGFCEYDDKPINSILAAAE
jgi:hypothetical protein